MKNMVFKRKLPVPKEIKEQYPLTAELAKIKEERDAIIADVFTGKSDKMVLIIGPAPLTERTRCWNTAAVLPSCRTRLAIS